MPNTWNKVGELVSDSMEQGGEKSLLLAELMFFVAGILLLVLAPFYLARVVLEWSQSTLPVVLHIIVLLAFFAILGFWAWLISGDRGKKLFKSLYRRGIKWPFLFSIALLLFAMPCFASLTITLNDHHIIKFEPATPHKEMSVSGVQGFYTWHFLDAIPSLNVPETLGWSKPYKYSDRLSGLLLLGIQADSHNSCDRIVHGMESPQKRSKGRKPRKKSCDLILRESSFFAAGQLRSARLQSSYKV